MKVNEQFTVGSQPTMEELRELADKGFKTVVNVREAGETEQPHSPGEEGEEVRKLDMQYLNTPVSSEAIQTAQIDAFRAQIGELQGPIFGLFGFWCGKQLLVADQHEGGVMEFGVEPLAPP